MIGIKTPVDSNICIQEQLVERKSAFALSNDKNLEEIPEIIWISTLCTQHNSLLESSN